MVIQRQQTPRYLTTISSFPVMPSSATLDVREPRPKFRREVSTFSGLSSARTSRSHTPLSSVLWTSEELEARIGIPSQPGPTCMPDSMLSEYDAQEGDIIELDQLKSKKKKRLFVRVVRKAGALASKKLGIRKSTPKPPEVQRTATPHMAAVMEAWQSANLSKTSLVAVEGSPQTLRSPPTQPAVVLEEETVIEVFASGGSTQKEYPLLARLNFSKMLQQTVLFLPHTALIGFAAFLAPQRLSEIAFSRLFGYAKRPANPTGIFVHHAHTLPYQCGLAIGVFSALLWALFKIHPGLAAFAFIVAYVCTVTAWHDYDTSADAGRAFLGIDDRDAIYWILRGYVLGELVCSFDDFSRWFKEEKEVEEHEEEEELESFERNWEGDPAKDGPLNYLIRLKDRPQETMRIVVEAPEMD